MDLLVQVTARAGSLLLEARKPQMRAGLPRGDIGPLALCRAVAQRVHVHP